MPDPYWSDGHATIWHGNALDLPLPDESVDLIVTSPPYFGLRSYQDGGEHYSGQIGSEATPAEFVDALIAATAEMVRVLKPSGSIAVNLGDKYVADNRGSAADVKRGAAKHAPRGPAGYPTGGMRQKSLMGLPWRYALRCIDDLGLILRAEIVLDKKNGLPESVNDRVRRSHEQVFHFVKQPRYYSAVDTIREAHEDTSQHAASRRARTDGRLSAASAGQTSAANPLGKLPGSVWPYVSQPFRAPAELGVDHFAAFAMDLPRRIIRGWSPRDVCTACGEGRRPVSVEVDRVKTGGGGSANQLAAERAAGGTRTVFAATTFGSAGIRAITGYVCACTPYTDHPGSDLGGVAARTGDVLSVDPGNAPRQTGGSLGSAPRSGAWREYHHDRWTPAPTTPGVVLDPFGGTGTTALVATVEGRTAHHVDLSADYCRLAQWRLTDPGERARAMQVDKPQREIDGQDDLFSMLEVADA